jgi:hypothetical protein
MSLYPSNTFQENQIDEAANLFLFNFCKLLDTDIMSTSLSKSYSDQSRIIPLYHVLQVCDDRIILFSSLHSPPSSLR